MEDFDFPDFEDVEKEEGIFFSYEGVDEDIIDEEKIEGWIRDLFENEKKIPSILNYIFCTDDFLLEINKEYLNHDTYTDIITFQYSSNPIEGDIYISVERTRENAAQLGTEENEELRRVIIHGALHLCGYKDKSEEEEEVMRSKEDYYLAKYR